MCGIVGAIAERSVQPILIEGLKRLEYRGYDSAGIATLQGMQIHRLRAQGKVVELEHKLTANSATLGIAHTRWATHGVPSEANAHPHMSGERFAVVHNGIIENHGALRDELQGRGCAFTSETDTEVVAHLLAHLATSGLTMPDLFRAVLDRIQGAYALCVIDQSTPDRLYVARQGSPLVIGLGLGENFVGSDQLALTHVTDRFMYLDEGDWGVITREQVRLWDVSSRVVERAVVQSHLGTEAVSKGSYRHFMAKEIHEQPRAVLDSLRLKLGSAHILSGILGPGSDEILDQVGAVQIVACGTSYHAGLVARYWIESLAGIPCQVEIASEYRYRDVVTLPNTLWIAISQSGETADVLAALRHLDQAHVLATLAVCNVATSSLIRETDLALLTDAGPEIGVASTKAFTTQLTVLLVLAGLLAKSRKVDSFDEKALVAELRQLPDLLTAALAIEPAVATIAELFADKQHTLFLGRGAMNPIAMEGALKLKELSYIHAEAYPAGELKHGPLALVDESMPVVAVAPNDALIEKLQSNLSEVRARGGQLIVFADHAVAQDGHSLTCVLPAVPARIAPIVFTVPLQLLSYHVAVLRGTDVDQPRNLAKSVTVE
ncbi:MAG: glutamine--fructose-6-phosphate transaminase (isomerizing) [Litorivicinaceae bacterium]|jgi:glutamine---fructose-6-phosphate transaminase (isomerizing)|nr:glutamine--fructose-6-phosphate transaminase (isomerizing) [Litorivicinaceae bacterium]MDP5329795.1 glutamine--fructose-6-phosphate transaminase (isomerizing) [Litorivicinaceae bacterium]MDP5341382.1 glutamine--fructose-6-phosphate transaminase (isomerizing) [Litorivicinaceae bacterium]MDP5363031.1 glutamine--fructose-6-phosphate transaminase (isomerizing) [Litorivicinaceae bacterium]